MPSASSSPLSRAKSAHNTLERRREQEEARRRWRRGKWRRRGRREKWKRRGFQSKAMNEVDAARDRATPASVGEERWFMWNGIGDSEEEEVTFQAREEEEAACQRCHASCISG